MCMRTILKQLVNWRQQSQQRSWKSHRRNVCESLTICATYASVPSTPRMPFGAHFVKNIKMLCKLTQMAKTLWKDHP
jgi:hypothetical protein